MIKKSLGVSVVLVLIMAAISVYGALAIPEDALVAAHWNFRGDADRFYSRDFALISGPAFGALLSAIFAILPLIDPRAEHIRKSSGLYLSAWLGGLFLFTVIHGAIILAAAQGRHADPGVIIAAVAVVIAVIGNFMAKSRSSWFIGFRTPWTLSSESAWIAANRAAGWLFVLTGVLAFAAIWLYGARTGGFVLLAGLFAAVVVGVVVSFVVWRRDPERTQG